MKKRILTPFLLLVISLITGCESPQALVIKHTISYSHKGTRSEAQHGHLKINNKKFTSHFSYIIANNKHFSFFTRQHLWGFDGYHPVINKEMQLILKTAKISINKKQLATGWYLGNKKLQNTPLNWIYLKWQTGSGFVSFDKINDLIKVKKIPFLKRRGLPPGFMIKEKGIR